MGKQGVTGESGNCELLLIRNINHMYGGKKNRLKGNILSGNVGTGNGGNSFGNGVINK
jgi:hypothetical protein